MLKQFCMNISVAFIDYVSNGINKCFACCFRKYTYLIIIQFEIMMFTTACLYDFECLDFHATG